MNRRSKASPRIVAARQQQQPTLDLRLQSELGRSLLIELEVAGELTPLIGKSIDHLARKLEPGLDGVAMRAAARNGSYLFPSQLRITNQAGDPQGLLFNLFLNAGSAREGFLRCCASQNDISLYRFRTTHLTQTCRRKWRFSRPWRGDAARREAEVTAGRSAPSPTDSSDHLC